MARNITRFKRNVLSEYTAQKVRREEIKEQKKIIRRINSINEMLRSLKKTDLYDESVAVENLFTYLESAPINIQKTKKGYISVKGLSTKITQTSAKGLIKLEQEAKNKSMSVMVGINKAIDQFLKNQTHTVTGMKKLYEERRNELKNFIDDEEFVNELSMKDIKTIYSVFQSNQYQRLQGRMGSPEFFTLYTQAIDEQWSKERFLKEVEYYVDYGNDDDLKEAITEIYDKNIKKYAKRS